MTFKKLWLVRKPDRGQIKLREGGYYIYTAPKAAGVDSFQLRVCGTTNAQDGYADLQFSVQVD
ncbi:hypothetical protein [Rhodopseudomonas pseudopalustris]|uniref:Uncharacterized protein n=1 Tax=Rhodopseudomonas pseudopalustris TaxID=1513892 RepID=A0A1H8VAY1_9BRAD|nr:hypothetical protein [Rhodopseudomonas pseudopalustris]SEP12632.1 hypothetical protein SAMN05444123_108172 [Rhodopseudomonas pseudopalustris]